VLRDVQRSLISERADHEGRHDNRHAKAHVQPLLQLADGQRIEWDWHLLVQQVANDDGHPALGHEERRHQHVGNT
jgi:hypothetical protein